MTYIRMLILATAIVAGPGIAQGSGAPLDPLGHAHRDNTGTAETMRIHLIIEGRRLSATLEDSPAARDFLAQLPLNLQLTDYASTEKVAQLPTALSTAGAPDGFTPAAGDMAFYAPWGNLAIFYRPFGYSRGLIRLGRIEGDLQALRGRGAVSARFEVARD